MKRLPRIITTCLVLAITGVGTLPAPGQVQTVPKDKLEALDAKVNEANQAASSARKKLAIRRVIREVEGLIEKHPTAPNRFEALHVLFRCQQALVSLDKSSSARKAFLETCEKLAAAPNEYAALRLDADLLLTQARSARQGADTQARADALRPLVKRYRDTEVEAKVIRIAMIMALEFGSTRLVNDLRQVVAERFPGDRDLIQFQREKLAGQVFGAPFIGTFPSSRSDMACFPMDFLGTTTVIYCWSKENDGIEDLKALATAWKKAKAEHKPEGRFQFVSMNMDDLPDAGEKILREAGLDWQALKMPKGKDNPIYQTYIDREMPTILSLTPTGYTALFQSGGRLNRGYERMIQSLMARSWAHGGYSCQLQSIFSGELLVMSPQGDFDPAAPPEYQALATDDKAKQTKLTRTAECVPEEKLRAIQACFLNAPLRYQLPHDQVIANYQKADALCREVIATHPNAPDLWIVRNRRIAALMGLWRSRGDQEAFTTAVGEANTAVAGSFPEGTDVVARLCLARQALRSPDASPKAIIDGFLKASGGKGASGQALFAASLLALDAGDRLLHDTYRRAFLDQHANDPMMWTATAFMLDRYHRYWMYHPPFTAGWTYGRRQGYFLSLGTPEEAQRSVHTVLQTLDGKTVNIPASKKDKWTIIEFQSQADSTPHLGRYGTFVKNRPFDDVQLIVAMLDNNTDEAKKALENRVAEQKKRKRDPDPFTTMMVPDGLANPIVAQLGIMTDAKRPNILVLRPDGTIAAFLSSLAMSAQSGNVMQNLLEHHDETLVDEALARKDLNEAKRLAFAHAPEKQEPPANAPRNWKPKKISVPHLRSRAKVYLAMGKLDAALADAEAAYLEVNRKAGHISMRTDDLEETEALRDAIADALKKQNP